jgi:hypothetical protein
MGTYRIALATVLHLEIVNTFYPLNINLEPVAITGPRTNGSGLPQFNGMGFDANSPS